MKYLFFFNGQPLLLCCVWCKIAIQDFVTGLHKKKEKNLRFHRRVYRRTITRRYFTETCKKITGLCHNHRRQITHRYLTESFKKITGLCHNHRRVYRRKITCRYFIKSCTKITGLCHNHWRVYRRIYAHPKAHACLTRVRLHKYWWSFWRIEKCGGIFELFLVRISINFWRYYRRNLMPPTTINLRR